MKLDLCDKFINFVEVNFFKQLKMEKEETIDVFFHRPLSKSICDRYGVKEKNFYADKKLIKKKM